MPPETFDSLDKDSLTPQVAQLLARIDALLEQNKTLLARIAELEAKLGAAAEDTGQLIAAALAWAGRSRMRQLSRARSKGRPGVARPR